MTQNQITGQRSFKLLTNTTRWNWTSSTVGLPFDFHVHYETCMVSFLPMVALISRRFLPGSMSFWAFVFIFNLLISYHSTSMPSCVKDCNRNFSNDAALIRHCKACPVLKSVPHVHFHNQTRELSELQLVKTCLIEFDRVNQLNSPRSTRRQHYQWSQDIWRDKGIGGSLQNTMTLVTRKNTYM